MREKSLREIKSLDAGSWFSAEFAGEEVLVLEEAIEILRGRVALNLEMKGDSEPGPLELRCIGVVSGMSFLDQTVFSSFSARRVRTLRDLSPEARVGILVEDGSRWNEAFSLARELSAEAAHPEHSLVDSRVVSTAHDLGLEVRAWPVNRIEEMRALVAAGVDGIFTDYPERLLRLRDG